VTDAGRRAAAVVAVLALGLLGACRAGGDDPVDVVRAAPQKTLDAGSARAAITISLASAGATGAVTGEGVFDLRAGRGSLNLDLGAFGATFGASTLDAVLDRNTIFVQLPPQLATVAGRTWVRIDLAALSQQAGLDIGSLGQLQSVDPSVALRFLEGAASDMREVGEERVRGAQTTHYRGTIDLRRAASEVDAGTRPAVEQAIESLGTSTIPADLWIDGEGRLRKLAFDIVRTDAGPQTAGRVELELYDFGTAVDVRPPPADQVTDLTALLAGPPGR
jgi:hypothetical protein